LLHGIETSFWRELLDSDTPFTLRTDTAMGLYMTLREMEGRFPERREDIKNFENRLDWERLMRHELVMMEEMLANLNRLAQNPDPLPTLGSQVLKIFHKDLDELLESVPENAERIRQFREELDSKESMLGDGRVFNEMIARIKRLGQPFPRLQRRLGDQEID